MRMKSKIFLCLIFINISTTPFAKPLEYQAKGALTFDGNTIDLKSAIAIWKPKMNDLMIELLPDELSSEEIKTIQNEKGVKPWLEWGSLRRAILHIFIKNPEKKLTISNISRFTLIHNGPSSEDYLAITFYSPQESDAKITEINGDIKSGSDIQITTEGDTSLGKHKLKWSFELNSIVIE